MHFCNSEARISIPPRSERRLSFPTRFFLICMLANIAALSPTRNEIHLDLGELSCIALIHFKKTPNPFRGFNLQRRFICSVDSANYCFPLKSCSICVTRHPVNPVQSVQPKIKRVCVEKIDLHKNSIKYKLKQRMRLTQRLRAEDLSW